MTTASPTIQSALKDVFLEAVVACDMTRPCKFPSLNSYQKRLLWTHKEVDLVSNQAVGLVVEVGDAGNFPQAFGLESLISFLSVCFFFSFSTVSKQGPCFTTVEEDGGEKRLVQLKLACEADGTAPPDPV